jgi:hypothetical protein
LASITIDGKEHDLEKLSEGAKGHISALQIVDAEIRHLQIKLSIATTAREVHAKALAEELDKKPAKK